MYLGCRTTPEQAEIARKISEKLAVQLNSIAGVRSEGASVATILVVRVEHGATRHNMQKGFSALHGDILLLDKLLLAYF